MKPRIRKYGGWWECIIGGDFGVVLEFLSWPEALAVGNVVSLEGTGWYLRNVSRVMSAREPSRLLEGRP